MTPDGQDPRGPATLAHYRMGTATLGGVTALAAVALFCVVVPVALALGSHGAAGARGWVLAAAGTLFGAAVLWSVLVRLALSLAVVRTADGLLLEWQGLVRRGAVPLAHMYRVDRWTRFALTVTFPGAVGGRDRHLTLLRDPALQAFLVTLAGLLGGIDPFAP